jgi:hypothetical protein
MRTQNITTGAGNSTAALQYKVRSKISNAFWGSTADFTNPASLYREQVGFFFKEDAAKLLNKAEVESLYRSFDPCTLELVVC